MSSGQAYRERGADRGERDPSYRGHYNNRGGGGNFRGRGGANTGYKPRRYWDSDDFYKDERDHGHGGRGRRRRSYNSRSRSRSRSYSSRSRSRSRSPSRRGRSRTPPPPRQTEEYVPRSTQQRNDPVDAAQAAPEPYEPYVPSKDPANSWTGTRMNMTQEYIPQANGQTAAVLSQMNPYGHVDAMPMYQGMYPETSTTIPVSGQAPPVGYGYGHSIIPVAQYPPQPQVAAETYQYPRIVQGGGAVPPPPAISESKSSKEVDVSKKKKDKRKKKKRHHSSSSSSSSSDDSSDSRRRRKGKKDNSDSSSDEDKKETGSSVGLTTQQKEALLKQREGYQTKLEILEREIGKLQSKEDELIRSRADRLLIDENLKLQAELKGRCKAVAIVLEKIDDVLKMGGKSGSSGEKPKLTTPQPTTVPPPPKITQPPAEDKNLIVPDRKDIATPYDYFDNAKHWCRLCNVFPATVQQMLAHFHSKEHHDQIQQLGIDEKPWHKRSSVCDLKPVSGARKAPFRGMQFFSPVEGWYCRLCNNWMGDPHCAVEHLKSAEHNSNYMNFLEEHPDWEKKWVSDREKALGASGKVEPTPIPVKKSRFDDPRVPIPIEKNLIVKEEMDSGKSIRVTMRNSLKGDEREEASKFAAPLNEGPTGRDSGLDEWMNKPKVSLDIDTQKFAAIVRQKHGLKEKDVREKIASPEVKCAPPIAPQISQRERDRDLKRDDRRRPDKVELQISNRERDRGDRYRERDNRTSRRRSRSRSRSRSRERRYGRRRSRSRSRSRSRDRSDRDRRDRGDRERPELKEAVKKLPMIGKMPLYKRPVFTKEKPDLEDRKEPPLDIPAVVLPPVKFMQKASLPIENASVSMFGDNPMSKSGFSYGAPSTIDNDRFGLSSMTAPSYGDVPSEAAVDVNIPEFHHPEPAEDVPSGEAKSVDKDGAPAALPDDFQQALDIIYAVGGQPKSQTPAPLPVPPPVSSSTANGVSEEHAGAASGSADYDYSSMGANGYPNYMEYQPYQQSFDGYAPVSYEELDDGPPGVGDDNPSTNVSRPLHFVTPAAESRAEEKQNDPPPPGDDDMDDLRMLGIDVDDTAVVIKR